MTITKKIFNYDVTIFSVKTKQMEMYFAYYPEWPNIPQKYVGSNYKQAEANAEAYLFEILRGE